jgi:hypothetical protein
MAGRFYEKTVKAAAETVAELVLSTHFHFFSRKTPQAASLGAVHGPRDPRSPICAGNPGSKLAFP